MRLTLYLAIVSILLCAPGCSGPKDEAAPTAEASAKALDPGKDVPPNLEAGKDIDGPIMPGDENSPGREVIGG